MDNALNSVKDTLVRIDGSAASLDALALALQLSKKNKGTVYAVYVIEVARAMALDADLPPEAAEGEEMLSKAEALATEMDYEVSGELLQARDAGHAIVDEAIERAVDAVILGIDYTTAPGELGSQSNAMYVMTHAPCRVIVWRSAIEEGAR